MESIIKGDGGGLLANVNRWRKQINLPPITLEEVRQQTFYSQSSIGEVKLFEIVNQEDLSNAFMCAVITAKNSTIFLKLSIEANSFSEVEKEFRKFASSFKYVNNE